jgi:hypothetical protein
MKSTIKFPCSEKVCENLSYFVFVLCFWFNLCKWPATKEFVRDCIVCTIFISSEKKKLTNLSVLGPNFKERVTGVRNAASCHPHIPSVNVDMKRAFPIYQHTNTVVDAKIF